MPVVNAPRWARWFPELSGTDDVARLLGDLLPPEPAPDPTPLATPAAPAAPAAPAGNVLDGVSAPGAPFVPLLRELVGPALAAAAAELDREPLLAADPAAVLAGLVESLHERTLRVLVAQLHEAAAAGRLAGDDPEARFADFAAGLSAAGFRDRWPALAADLDRMVADRRVALRAVLAGTWRHRSWLTGTFPELAGAGRVTVVDTGRGDTHRGGASVAVLTFESGCRLVVKPRSLAVDAAYGQLLDRLDLDLWHPRVATTGDLGWMEHVAYRPPADPAEARTYYTRVGRLAALLHLLDACDVHHENLICVGDTPVLVDCETLLRAALPPAGPRTAREVIEDRLAGSVTGLGLLPTVVMGADSAGADIGGIGYEAGARSPFKSLAVRNPGRDDMSLAFARGGMSADPTVPAAAGLLTPAQLLAALQEGFRAVGTWATGHAVELAGHVTELFAGVELRYLHNPTFFYAQLLAMTHHPEPAADPDARRVLLCRVGLRRPDAPLAVTRAELRDLDRGDVPYFTARADSTELRDSTGRPLGPLLRGSPLAGARDRILAFDARALAEQLDLIGLTLVNKYGDGDTATRFTLDGPAPARSGDADRIAAAAELGDRLLAGMVPAERPDSPPGWMGPQITADEARLWRPGALGFDLYGGGTGIVLLLAALARVTGEPRFRDGALRALEPLATELAAGALDRDVAAGYLDGTAGVVWAVAHAGRLLDRPDLTAAAVAELPRLAAAVDRDTAYDFIGGAAGMLAVALALHRLADSADALAVARRAAAHLAAGYPGLTGDAGAAAGVRRLLDVLEGMRTPDDWFTSTLRTRTSAAWCHGSPGILLGLALTARAGLPVPAGRVAEAVANTVAGGLGTAATYCHGDFGNLEILGLAADVTGDRALAARVATGSRRLLHSWHTHADRNPHSKYAYSPSAMVGSAAAGFWLLRSVVGDEVPALLRAG